jgi:hypothetical protein
MMDAAPPRSPGARATVLAALLFATTSCAPARSATQPACTLTSTRLPVSPLPADLLRLDGQFFHPRGREPFNDLIPGTSRYAYYDPGHPFARAEPPPGIDRVRWLTEHALVGTGSDGAELLIAPRDGRFQPRRLRGTAGLQLEAVAEARSGAIWILVRQWSRHVQGSDAFALVRGDRDEAPRSFAAAAWSSDAALAVTASGDVAAAWVEAGPAPGIATLRLAWLDAARGRLSVRDADHVALPRDAPYVALITGFNVVVAGDGDGAAIAWRPLDEDGPPPSTWYLGRPWLVEHPATVRVLRADAGAIRLVSRHPTRVQRRTLFAGAPPWGLDPGGAWAFSLGGRAVVAWLDQGEPDQASIVAALVGDARPTVLDADGFDTRLEVAAAREDGVELYAYRSEPSLRRFVLGCREDGGRRAR